MTHTCQGGRTGRREHVRRVQRDARACGPNTRVCMTRGLTHVTRARSAASLTEHEVRSCPDRRGAQCIVAALAAASAPAAADLVSLAEHRTTGTASGDR
jgi:hypothetical protein